MVHRPDEEVFTCGLPGGDRRARVAPGKYRRPGVESQSPLGVFPCMASMAALDEERTDDSLEMIVGGGSCNDEDGRDNDREAQQKRLEEHAWSRRWP